MTIEEACATILSPETAHAIIMDQGVRWAVVMAMTVATTTTDPEALAAIDNWRQGEWLIRRSRARRAVKMPSE